MAAQTKMQKNNQMIAELLLRVQGEDYYEWLDRMHAEVISKNTDTIKHLSNSTLNVSNHNNSSQREEN